MSYRIQGGTNVAGTRVGTRRRLSLVLGFAAAAVVLVQAPSSATTVPAEAGAAPHRGCAAVVELQALNIPTAPPPRRSAGGMQPDDGGAVAPAVTLVHNHDADPQTLDLIIDTGDDTLVRPVYVAPQGCRIAWNGAGPVQVDPAGRRSAHTPAMTVRLTATEPPTCVCARPV